MYVGQHKDQTIPHDRSTGSYHHRRRSGGAVYGPVSRSEQARYAAGPLKRSMAKWEAEGQNCLGFPPEPGFLIVTWSGTQFEVEAAEDEVQSVMTNGKTFQPIE